MWVVEVDGVRIESFKSKAKALAYVEGLEEIIQYSENGDNSYKLYGLDKTYYVFKSI